LNFLDFLKVEIYFKIIVLIVSVSCQVTEQEIQI